MKLPIIRKIIQVGQSKAVSLPKSWLRFYEQQNECKITEVLVEVNGVLKISPVIPKPGIYAK
jgi:hypothetical protein